MDLSSVLLAKSLSGGGGVAPEPDTIYVHGKTSGSYFEFTDDITGSDIVSIIRSGKNVVLIANPSLTSNRGVFLYCGERSTFDSSDSSYSFLGIFPLYSGGTNRLSLENVAVKNNSNKKYSLIIKQLTLS